MRSAIERRAITRYRWDKLKVSFWFAPMSMALAAVLLAWAMAGIDVRTPNEIFENSRFILTGTTGELRSALLNMAGTVLATAGVVFTLLTLPLSTVAAQYGSRLLRLFVGDRTTQFVLGMFVGTFVYSAAAALSIPSVAIGQEPPLLTATVGLYLMLATFASLIALIQHISTMLQAPNIAAAAGEELRAASRENIVHDFAAVGGIEAYVRRPDAVDTLAETEFHPVHVQVTGYIHFIDFVAIFALARNRNLAIRLLHRPGSFVRAGAVVAQVWPAEQANRQLLDRLIGRALRIGNGRTPTQDVEYAVKQLAEMAVRAMSPAINDPFTAMTCLDHMGTGLAEFIRQSETGAQYFYQDDRLRLILEPVTFAALLSAAFDMLRHASCDNASVLLHMLDTIDVIATEASSALVRQELFQHVNLIQAESQAGALIGADRHAIQLRTEALRMRLEA